MTAMSDFQDAMGDYYDGGAIGTPPTFEQFKNPDPILCPAQTYRQTRDTPAECCENEVADYGDLCPEHDYTSEDAADDAREQAYESRLGY